MTRAEDRCFENIRYAHFMKVVRTAIAYSRAENSFTDGYACRVAAERGPAASPSGRLFAVKHKKSSRPVISHNAAKHDSYKNARLWVREVA